MVEGMAIFEFNSASLSCLLIHLGAELPKHAARRPTAVAELAGSVAPTDGILRAVVRAL
jgi:hypothetical protein